MRPELISFDAAGTLIDVEWHPGKFAVERALEVGIPLDRQVAEETYSRLLYTRWREYGNINRTRNHAACDAFWRDLSADWLHALQVPPDSLEPLLDAAERELYGPEQRVFRLYPDALPTLEKLKEDGWRMVILSNWDYSLHRIARNLGLEPFFEHIFASLEEGPEKPHPDLFRTVEQRTGVASASILHIGDHPVDDVEGARGAGWRSVFLDRSREGSWPPVMNSLTQAREAIDWSA
jgi:putative hydrolase of the HAD superfamily